MGNLNGKLVEAVEENRLEDVKELLGLGASQDAQDKDGWTVLTKACLHGFESIVKVLLENQADVNLTNRIGGTALTYAAMRGHHAIVKILLATNADIEYKSTTGRTAFYWAMNKRHMSIAGDLLMASPTVQDFDVKRLSQLLEWACLANQIHVVRKIVQERPDIKWDDAVPGGLLQLALSNSSSDVADFLSEMNVGCDRTDEGSEEKLVASGEQTGDLLEDSWQTTIITVRSADRIPQPVASTISVGIGKEGGQLQSTDVSIIIPEAAISSTTTFSAKTYLDPSVMPPISSEQQLVLSPAVRLSASLPRSHQFNKPLQLSLPPEVPLQASSHNSGWLLELMRSESSPDGLPGEWETVLEYNTNTGKVVSHSPFIHYDPVTCSFHVDHFCWFSWIGRPLRAIGNMLGISSLRKIDYAVFGKQVHRHKWCIATHIVHGARSIYDSLAKNLQVEGYLKLSPPNRDYIGYYGEVCLIIQCMKPWQMHQGKSKADIETKRIWRCEQDSSCYYECTLQDSKQSADALECTITVVYQSSSGKDARKPVELNICHSLDKPQCSPSVGEDDVDPFSHCALMATRVRNAADIMGGFWRVTSEFPITVLDEVSELVASNSKAHLLADSLPGYNPHSGEQLVQSAGYVRCMLDTWIMSESSGATLDCLFRAMHRVGLFHTLRRAIEHRIECQPLPTGIDLDEVFDVVIECGPDRWYDIGLKLKFTDGRLNELVGGLYGGGQKLRRIINTKVNEMGAQRAAEELWKACSLISDPIIGVVADKLKV